MTTEKKSSARLLLEADQADRRAAMLDGFASETEGRAYRMGPGSRLYYEALEKVERHRADARAARSEATSLRAQARRITTTTKEK